MYSPGMAVVSAANYQLPEMKCQQQLQHKLQTQTHKQLQSTSGRMTDLSIPDQTLHHIISFYYQILTL